MSQRRHLVLTVVLGLGVIMTVLPVASASAEAAPQFYKNNKIFRNDGHTVATFALGPLKLASEALGTVECQTNSFGQAINSSVNGEQRGTYEVQGWNAFNCTSTYIKTLEEVLKKQLERKEIQCATTGATIGEGECLTIFATAETTISGEDGKIRRGHSSLPWKSELVRAEREGEAAVELKTGVHAYGEAVGADSGQSQTGPCYPTTSGAPANWHSVPSGCMVINLVLPQVPDEIVLYGTLEPGYANGAKSGLDPSRLEFAESGRLFSSEGLLGDEIEASGTWRLDGYTDFELLTAK